MGGPKQSCTDTKDGTRCDNKGTPTRVGGNSRVKLRLEEFLDRASYKNEAYTMSNPQYQLSCNGTITVLAMVRSNDVELTQPQ